MQPDRLHNDLFFAAERVCRALDDGPLYGHDAAALLLRNAVQAQALADVQHALDLALAELDGAREAVTALRAEAEQSSATITSLRRDVRDLQAANSEAMRTIPRRAEVQP
jgi:hypothetical protein